MCCPCSNNSECTRTLHPRLGDNAVFVASALFLARTRCVFCVAKGFSSEHCVLASLRCFAQSLLLLLRRGRVHVPYLPKCKPASIPPPSSKFRMTKKKKRVHDRKQKKKKKNIHYQFPAPATLLARLTEGTTLPKAGKKKKKKPDCQHCAQCGQNGVPLK